MADKKNITNVELKLKKELKTKKVFNIFVNGVDSGFRALEKYNNGQVKTYPFFVKNNTVFNKYKNIKCITFRDGIRPKTGVSLNIKKGFGFTKPKGVSKLFYYFQEVYPRINEVIFVKKGKSEIKNNKLVLVISDFYKLESRIGAFFADNKEKKEAVFQNSLSIILPRYFKKVQKYSYNPGVLANFIGMYSLENIKLSDTDYELLQTLITKSHLPTDILVSTKREIDIVYIEDIINEFKDLMTQSTKTERLEEKWHQFFRKHSWIFSQIFSFPAVFLKDKFNVGGQDIGGNTDKIVDFLYKNKITNNIAFVEIKTHLTDLMQGAPYRKPDIFSISPKLTGAIIQVLDQKTKLLQHWYQKIGNKARSLNSICVVIAGNTSKLSKKGQQESFELFRWSNKDVIIIPFNELLEKIELLLKIFKKK